jgi:bifunctional UDP-N-acetylglucosamine pyrophosphorylase/glucosamine-1-phosphate N-acetyltransferase
VELKNSFVGNNSKVPHLTYIGDASIGKNVNIGAGTITCNYDGKRKWRTVIEDDAFIGSNSNLVAPLTIGEGAYVAAGSTLTKDLPEKSLGIARGRQVVIKDWVTRKEGKKD